MINKISSKSFIEDNLQKVSEILIKYDPVKIVFYYNEKVENPDGYDSEAKMLLKHIHMFGGIKNINKQILHNLLYSCFCHMFGNGISFQTGLYSRCSMKELKKLIGKKESYKFAAKEIWELLNRND